MPAAVSDIHRFIRSQRSGIYSMTSKSYEASCTYYCHACSKQVKFWSQSSLSKMTGKNGHEHFNCHIIGLQKLRGHQASKAAPDSALEDDEGADAAASAVVPVPARAECRGVSTEDAALVDLKKSLQTFMFYGQPRTVFKGSEKDPLGEVTLTLDDSVVRVRSTACLGFLSDGQGVLSCKVCRRAAMLPSFRAHIAKKAYFIDLIVLSWKLFHCSEKESMEFASAMQRADYVAAGLAGTDLQELLQGGQDKLDIVRTICHRAVCVPAHRRSESFQKFLDSYLVQPHMFCADSSEAAAHGALASSLARGVAQGTVRSLDLQLAAKIAAGQLRQDALLQSITASFLFTAHLGAREHGRRTSSRHVDLEAVGEALAVLGRRGEVDELLERFGINMDAVPRAPLESPILPNPWVSLRTDQELRQTIQRCLSALRLCGQRSYMLVDETVWCPNWEQVSSLRVTPSGQKENAWVGGHWDPQDDWSYLRTADYSAADLPEEKKARLTLHLCLKRPDNNRFVLDACTLRRKQGQASSLEMLHLVDRFLLSATTCNGGIPPLGIAFDGATVNSKICRAFSGLLPESDFANMPFFGSCRIERFPDLRFWPFGQLIYQDGDHKSSFPMQAFIDGYHAQKRFSLQGCAGVRFIVHGCVWTCLSGQMRAGIGARTHGCAETQSDRAAVARLSPTFTPRAWDCAGCQLHILIGSFIASVSSASPAFSKLELAEHSFCLHYMMILHLMCNRARFVDEWESFSLALTTIRNICSLASHCLMSCRSSFEPRLLQELPIEFHFGRLKRHCSGSPSIKDYLFAQAVETARQEQRLRGMDVAALNMQKTSQCRDALSDQELQEASKRALASALAFQAYIQIDTTVDDLYQHLRQWWPAVGQKLLTQNQGHADDEAEAGELDLDMVAMLDSDMVELSASKLRSLATCAAEQPEEPGSVVERVASQAVLRETLQECRQDPTRMADIIDEETGEHQASIQELEALTTKPLPLEKEEQDAPQDGSGQPKTLRDILHLATLKDEAAFDVTEATGAGSDAALQRISCLTGPIRHFSKFVRLEEGILSLAWLEKETCQANEWNRAEHEISLARQNASSSKVRIARSTMWANSVNKLCSHVASHNVKASAVDRGLWPADTFRPPVSLDKKTTFQVLLLKGSSTAAGCKDRKVLPCCVLAAFRGSVVKTKTGNTVRTGKPCSTSLPAGSCRMLHASELVSCEGEGPSIFFTSTACQPIMLDPTGCVLGELSVTSAHRVGMRLRVELSPAAVHAMTALKRANAKLPDLEEVPPAPAMDAAADVAPANTFNETSFTKKNLATKLPDFLCLA